MTIHCQPNQSAATYNRPGRAIQDTEWVKDPANPTTTKGGKIRKGEKVLFQQEQFGSGPAWQPALVEDQMLGYVHPSHFEEIIIGKQD